MGAKTKKRKIRNTKLDYLEEEVPKKSFTTHDLKSFRPTPKQQEFFNLYYQDLPVIIQHGSAGTGKSRTTLHAMFTELFDPETPYKKIIVIRSAVETRSIGFMKGDLAEKQMYYETPIANLVNTMFKYKNSYKWLKQGDYVEFRLSTFIRGETLSNALILVEESQNMDAEELESIITRLGENSRMVIVGDVAQGDLHRKREKSGLPAIMALLERVRGNQVGFVEYRPEDVCRSGFVRDFLIAKEIYGL